MYTFYFIEATSSRPNPYFCDWDVGKWWYKSSTLCLWDPSQVNNCHCLRNFSSKYILRQLYQAIQINLYWVVKIQINKTVIYEVFSYKKNICKGKKSHLFNKKTWTSPKIILIQCIACFHYLLFPQNCAKIVLLLWPPSTRPHHHRIATSHREDAVPHGVRPSVESPSPGPGPDKALQCQ